MKMGIIQPFVVFKQEGKYFLGCRGKTLARRAIVEMGKIPGLGQGIF